MFYKRKFAVLLISLLLIGPSTVAVFTSSPTNSSYHLNNYEPLKESSLASNWSTYPLQRAVFVAPDSESYLDEFSYMAAIPMSLFYDAGNKYISPLLYSEAGFGSDNLLDDWVEYLQPDGGVSQAVAIGDISPTRIGQLQRQIGSRIYPQISGDTSYEIAAKIAANDWKSSDIAVLAISRDDFDSPTTQTGSSSFVFENAQLQTDSFQPTLTPDAPLLVEFEPPTDSGWIYGVFNWTTSDPLIHQLRDPAGNVVDYSVYSQAFHKRSSATVDKLVPTHFWLPRNRDGSWQLRVEPGSTLLNDLDIDLSISYYPSFRQSITVPSNTKWLNISTNWDNAGTNINPALIDPNGRMVQWEPSESLLSGAGGKTLEMPYPMQGEWELVCAWMDPLDENNKVDIDWEMNTIADDLAAYLESASNGAVLASLLNSPLLYAEPDALPTITEWALSRLGVSNVILVDPAGLQTSSLTTQINDHAMLTNLNTYPAVSNAISTLSNENSIVVSLPTGTGDEIFPAGALSGAYHGAPVFSLSGNDNSMTTRAEETWAPYLIGPNIDVFVTNNYEKRIENGWYDERIPNIYSMYHSADSFENFLTQRGAYNASSKQNVVIMADTKKLKTSFDRSLQSHFMPGRIPVSGSELAAFMINKATLHQFIFRTATSANTALLSMYAYTHGSLYVDNYGRSGRLYQYDTIQSDLQTAGFQVESHVGVNEVYSQLNSQVSLWSFSTHGTLTRYPDDPPKRPLGPGVFSFRDEDAPYGFEGSLTNRSIDSDQLVNPVLYSPESNHHIIRTTDDLLSSVDYLGAPIISITACLLGGTKFPRVMMERGAIGVIAAPRTVYFRPAGLLTVYLNQALTGGNTTGFSLNYALAAVSYDYTNIQSFSPQDYANQQILFGDPSVRLLHPDSTGRVASVSPDISFNNHLPNAGVSSIAAIGTTDYLPSERQTIGASYDFYSDSNISESIPILELFTTIIMEPRSVDDFSSFFSNRSNLLRDYALRGGTVVILGVNAAQSWLPHQISYTSNSTGSQIEITDSGHPFVSTPNQLASTYEYTGTFSTYSANLSVLATQGTSPVILAGHLGLGKVAYSTITEDGSSRRQIIENAVNWSSQPSLLLGSLIKNQEVIWSGDRVVIEMELIDAIGNPIEGATVQAWVNATQVPISEIGNGFYSVLLSENWTGSRTGIFDLQIKAELDGFDTLDATINDFVFIRPSPLPLILGAGGIVGVIAILWAYRKRKRGEPIFGFRSSSDSGVWSKLSPEAKKRLEQEEEERKRKQKEKDEEFDPKEVFGL